MARYAPAVSTSQPVAIRGRPSIRRDDSRDRLNIDEEVIRARKGKGRHSDGESGKSRNNEAFGEHGRSPFSFFCSWPGCISRSSDGREMATDRGSKKAYSQNFFNLQKLNNRKQLAAGCLIYRPRASLFCDRFVFSPFCPSPPRCVRAGRRCRLPPRTASVQLRWRR